MGKEKLIVLSKILLISWSVLIAVLLFKPYGLYTGILFFRGEDLFYHYGLFTVWSALVFSLFHLSSRPIHLILVFTLGAGLVFGAGTELVQVLIPSRVGHLNDFIADLAGVCTGFVIALTLKKQLDRIVKKYES